VEEKIETKVLKQQRLEGKREEKASEQAMIESPIGGIFEAQVAAKPRESTISKRINTPTGASVVEVLKPEFFNVKFDTRTEYYQHPPYRLKKDKVKRGYTYSGKVEKLDIWTTVMSKTKEEWIFIHISFPTEASLDSESNVT
jgi:hypothetical protein